MAIKEVILNMLYERVITDEELTTKELNSYGLTSNDITDLIKQGKLERVKRGQYRFLSIEDLFNYGKKLITLKEFEKATECFKRCYKINPNHADTCFQLFYRCIYEKNYDSALEYFEVFSKKENVCCKADCNLYLYLLSIITDIPEKYKEYVKELKEIDFMLEPNYKGFPTIPNNCRELIINHKFPSAISYLKNFVDRYSLTPIIINMKNLLFQATQKEATNNNELIKLVNQKQYNDVISFLESKQKRHNLFITDSYTLKLAYEIIRIKETGIILEKKELKIKDNLYEAIDAHDYETALILSKVFEAPNNINNVGKVIRLLLFDLCEIINQISKAQIENEAKVLEEEKIEEPVLSMSNDTINFLDIINYLIKMDIENAITLLKKYMNQINKSEYEFLIVDLIKLSLVEKDTVFTKPMIVLTHIDKGEFIFDVLSYISDFYIALAQNRFDEARIYLDIISNAKELGQPCMFADTLLEVLNNTEKMIENNHNEMDSDDQKQSVAAVDNFTQNTFLQSIENVQPNGPKDEASQNASEIEEISQIVIPKVEDSERKLLENKYELLLNNQGIVLLKPMDNQRRKRIHELVKQIPDIVSFSIGEGENRQVVLRYKPYITDINTKILLDEGNLAYKQGDYNLCIENYLKLLQYGTPKAFEYAKIGIAYYKLGKKAAAIDYLTVATELNKQEGGEFDFTHLIAKLKGIIPSEDEKPNFKMNLGEFESNIENNYGIQNFDDITSCILETGLDVESACEQFGMTEEEICKVKLLYAIRYYTQGNYTKGDIFLKSVEKSKNKTQFVINLCDEVRKGKKFYINRQDESSNRLALTISPRK